MFEIRYSTTAERALNELPIVDAQLVARMVQGLAELAEIYAPDHAIWSRLGKVARNGLEISVEDQVVRISLHADERALVVLEASPAPKRPAKPVSRRPMSPQLGRSRSRSA